MGLVLPLAFIDDTTREKEEGIVSLKIIPTRKVAVVLSSEAISILKKKDKRAADWFKQNGIPDKYKFLSFGLDEVEIL